MADFDPAGILADARAKEGVDDLGPGAFEEPMGVLLEAYAAADLNEIGRHLLRSGVVHSLRMRLRSQEWVRRHPEILEEVIVAPLVVVGMMRSGTTLVQRLLAADPRAHCAHGWEVVEVAPRVDHRFEEPGPDPRIAKGRKREQLNRELAPELFAIHPMHAMEAEEEIVFLADAFLSHVPESGADVPAYRAWIDGQDFTPAYDHLHRMLQFLQWQKRRRGEVGPGPGQRWVLKTPAHLGYLDDLRRRFPDLHVVHLHRDPVATIPSGASLNATLHTMNSDRVDLVRIGTEWLDRMGWTNDRALATRARWAGEGSAPVTDVQFEDAVADPVGQAARVYDAAGHELTAPAEAAIRAWLTARPHEAGGRPDYSPERFGLSVGQIRERFAAYDATFRG